MNGIREREGESEHHPPGVPRCRVCGELLEIAASGSYGLTFACPAPDYIGASEDEKKHYSDSRMEFRSSEDAEIYALRQEIRRLRSDAYHARWATHQTDE